MSEEGPKLKIDRSPINISEREKSQMAWVRNFREMLRTHPGIIKAAVTLTDRAIAEYNPPDAKYGIVELTYDKESGKWFEKGRTRFVTDEDGRTVRSKDNKPILEPHPMQVGRGTILVPGEPTVDQSTGLEVVVLGRSNRDFGSRLDKCDYLKMSIGDQSFFVKRSFISQNPGFTEFRNTISAKELLKDFPFVRVVDSQLGFQNQNESWYVSKWEDFITDGFGPYSYYMFDDYGNLIGVPSQEGGFMGFETEEEFEDVEEKAKQIKERLRTASIHRDQKMNLFYSRKTKSFVLLDVTGEDPSKTLGNPFRNSRGGIF